MILEVWTLKKEILNIENTNFILHKVEDVFNEHELNTTERQIIVNMLDIALKTQVQKGKSESMARQTLQGLGLGGALDSMKDK